MPLQMPVLVSEPFVDPFAAVVVRFPGIQKPLSHNSVNAHDSRPSIRLTFVLVVRAFAIGHLYWHILIFKVV